jgi:hypothetical protein
MAKDREIEFLKTRQQRNRLRTTRPFCGVRFIMKFLDLSKRRFERLVALTAVRKVVCGKTRVFWLCNCDCGRQSIVRSCDLVNEKTLSCGCYATEARQKQKANLKHGKSRTRLYQRWGSIYERCFNPKHRAYHRYGGRGISVCDEWRKLHEF